MSEREIIRIEAFMYADDAEPIATAWIRNNYVHALDCMPLNRLVSRVIDDVSDVTHAQLELLETAIRAEQYRREEARNKREEERNNWLSKL